jgi:hypothetical protein
MKKMRFLLVAVLLAASTTLMAQSTKNTVDESSAILQTDQLIDQLHLNSDQAQQILNINFDFIYDESLMLAQSKALLSKGWVEDDVAMAYQEALTNEMYVRYEAIKSVLTDQQQVAFEMLHFYQY